MNIYEKLARKQKKSKSFVNGEEFQFYLNNRFLLNKFPHFAFLYDVEESPFDVMRANILLRGLINKEVIEKEIKNIFEHQISDHEIFVNSLKERIVDQPYFSENKNKIYMPFFSRALNEIYLIEPEKILNLPYSELANDFTDSIVDPFDTYGAELFSSFFTSLVKIMDNGQEIAYFHYDTNAIYIVNSQGRLDCQICLFDKYLKKANNSHMLERIAPVVEAYFKNDRLGMVHALKDNALISETMFQIVEGK